jgi:hypothetical protein
MLSKRNLIILIASVSLVVLILLAIFLQGRAKGIALGLLFIVGFVGVFGGVILGLNYLNERYFVRPRKPTHLCPRCYSLYRNPEEQNCPYCQETFGLQKTLTGLTQFIQEQSRTDLEKQLKTLETDLKTARGRNILYIEHDMKNLKRVMRIQEERKENT